MTGLLVSVRSAAEAELALAGGADLIDVKEPRRGSLGAAEPAVWEEVRLVVASRAPTSAALGELLSDFQADHLPQAAGMNFAKVGLAGCSAVADWPARWLRAMQGLPRGVRPVAVAYADWQRAAAPAPDDVLQLAARGGAPYLLLDTFDKAAGNLLAHLSLDQLAALSRRAARSAVRLVLAGSLDAAAMEILLPLEPAYLAVRGAACSGDRTQAIEAPRVKRLAEMLRRKTAALHKQLA